MAQPDPPPIVRSEHTEGNFSFQAFQSAMLGTDVADDLCKKLHVHPAPVMVFDSFLKIRMRRRDGSVVDVLNLNTADGLLTCSLVEHPDGT